jgi:RNA polymerase sigma-70 factor (ECF subfamily)
MTERELIRGCQKGKAKYQRALVLRYSPMLMTVARRYTRDEPAAQDVLQEAYIKVFGAIGDYRPTGSFEAWLRRIVINKALESTKPMRHTHEAAGLEGVAESSVAPEALARLKAEDLIALIRQLPERFQQVFNLYAIEGYSHDEIAQMLHISPGTSRSQLTRARQKLQQLICERESGHYVKRAIG